MINAQKYADKEIYVRKRIVSFIEKIIRFFGNDIRHDVFKSIVYSEAPAATEGERMLKNYYDAYMYLLNNCKMALSQDILKKFIFIFHGEIVDEAKLTRITSRIFHFLDTPLLKKLVRIPMLIYKEFSSYGECERTMISLMFFNYCLVRDGIPTVHFLSSQLKEYLSLTARDDDEAMEQFILSTLENAKFQDKEYYKKLKKIDAIDIQKVFLSEKDVLINNYGVKHVYIYGSFAKGNERIDSDIDLMFDFSYELTYREKTDIIAVLSQHYLEVLGRYVDIHESGRYVNDTLIKEITNYIKIY